MASAPPDTASRETDRNAEAAALALLLLSRKRYDLPALIRANRIRPRAMRQMRPTNALKYDLAAPYYAIINAWEAQRPALMVAYATGDPVTIRNALDRATAQVEATVRQAQQRFAPTLQNVERWHRSQWVSRVKAATGLDVSMFTMPADVSGDLAASAAWNEQLATDVHRQLGHGVATALLAGAAASVPGTKEQAKARREAAEQAGAGGSGSGGTAPEAKAPSRPTEQPSVEEQITEAVAKARKRAAGIGDDQIDKVSRAMDRSRRQAASVSTYVWNHTQQPHPRHWHQARNGKTFTDDEIEDGDRAGQPPFCKCWERPVL